MPKSRYNSLKGFTLIEVVIVIAIIGITTSFLLIGLGTSKAKRELETNAREFVGIVREAQNDALTGRQLVVGTTPCWYQLDWSGGSYSLRYQYKNGSGVCTQSSVITTYSLKNGVTFNAAGTLQFSVPDATSASGKTVVLGKLGNTHTVCVSAAGQATEQTGTVSCP